MTINEALKVLTIKEKIALLSGDGMWHIKHLPKLGYDRFMMTDGPHGIRKQVKTDGIGISESYKATCFPTASLLACSFDKNLIYEVGKHIAKEAINQDVSMVLGPGINIKRSPLCGRNFEYFSEDPLLSGLLGEAYIRGVQSEHVGTSLKHFFANNQEKNRMTVDAIIDKRAMYEIYLRSFEIAIQAKPWSIMTAYNKVNGKYSAESKLHLTAIARNRYGFNGAFITDWGAMNNRIDSIKAGLSLEMPGSKQKELYKAYKAALITEDEIDFAVKPILWLLDKASKSKKTKTNQYYHDIAKKAALESIVLLKNDDQILPFNEDEKILYIGSMIKTPRYQGSGSSRVNAIEVISLYDSLIAHNRDFHYCEGYRLDGLDDQNLIDEAMELAKHYKKIVISIGLTDIYESEGFDRTHMNIPLNQLKLLDGIKTVSNDVVVILQGGSVTTMPYKDDVKGILNLYLGGEAIGEATQDILYGIHNPSGKLAETYPVRLDDCPSTPFFPGGNKSVYYAESIYVGYRYYNKKGLVVNYPFGYGLSYSQFKYQELKLSHETLREKEILKIQVTVSNLSNRDGKEVIQIYVSDLNQIVHKPTSELKAFEKIEIKAFNTVTIDIELPFKAFEYYDVEIDDFRVLDGHYLIQIGSSSRDIHLEKEVTIMGEKVDPEKPSLYTTLERYINIHDFEEIYGLLPTREHSDHIKFNLNSTVNDIKHTKIGHVIYNMGYKEINKSTADEPTKKMMINQFESLPLRALSLMSNDKLTLKRTKGLIQLMNKDIRGLLKLL